MANTSSSSLAIDHSSDLTDINGMLYVAGVGVDKHVILSAMRALKDDPSLSIRDAIKIGIDLNVA